MMFLSVTMGIPFHEVRQWSAAEVVLYASYYSIDPWGHIRDDARIGKQTADLALIQGVKKEGGEYFTPQDFTIKFGADEEEEPTDDGANAMRGLFNRAQ